MPSFSGAVMTITWFVGWMVSMAKAFTVSTFSILMSMLSSFHSVSASGIGSFLR